MSYASILVCVRDNWSRKNIIDNGLRVADTFGAHLTALHVYVPSDYAYASHADFPTWGGIRALQREQQQAAKRDAVLKAEFEAQVRAFANQNVEWRFHSGGLAEVVALHARYTDLVIMGQHDPKDRTSRGSFDAPAEVALLSPRPVLVVPHDHDGEFVSKRVLLAWNGSREATRAATAALPVLQRADGVDVVVVTGMGEAHGDEPGADIALYLARHGVNATVSRIPHGDLRVSEVLLSVAAERGSDLLCMGAYGHARLRELAFGGVTYELMRHMTIPTFIAA